MTATSDDPATLSPPPTRARRSAWTRLLVRAVAVSAAADVAVMAAVGSVIPPVAVGVAISLVGLLLLRRWPRTAIGLLATVSALLLVSGAPFALPHLAHPESALDFVHSFVHLGGRLLAVVAAIGAWRSASPTTARRLGAVAAGLLVATVSVGTVATLLTGRDAASPGDVTVPVRDFAFPSEVRVPAGATVFVDNEDLTRHTFTVEGTELSHELPGGAGARFNVDLPPGTYRLFCAVPGHDSMKAALVVQ